MICDYHECFMANECKLTTERSRPMSRWGELIPHDEDRCTGAVDWCSCPCEDCGDICK